MDNENTFLNNSWMNKNHNENKKLEMMDNKNTTDPNLQDAANAVVRMKSLVLKLALSVRKGGR